MSVLNNVTREVVMKGEKLTNILLQVQRIFIPVEESDVVMFTDTMLMQQLLIRGDSKLWFH